MSERPVALASLARQCFDLARPDDGLAVIQLAQYGTRHTATPRLRAVLATREAWAYALRGEPQAFRRAVGLAEDYHAEGTRDLDARTPSTPRNRTFDLIGLARAHLISRQPERAAVLVETALPLAGGWVSGRVGARLRDFHREAAPFASTPAVCAVREAIGVLVAA